MQPEANSRACATWQRHWSEEAPLVGFSIVPAGPAGFAYCPFFSRAWLKAQRQTRSNQGAASTLPIVACIDMRHGPRGEMRDHESARPPASQQSLVLLTLVSGSHRTICGTMQGTTLHGILPRGRVDPRVVRAWHCPGMPLGLNYGKSHESEGDDDDEVGSGPAP